MSCSVSKQSCCTLGSVYHSFRDNSNKILKRYLHQLEEICITCEEEEGEGEWGVVGNNLSGCQDMDQICEITLQGLHSIMLTTMRSSVEQYFTINKKMADVSAKLSKVTLKFSNALLEQARLSITLALTAHENITSVALIEGARKSAHNMVKAKERNKDLFWSSMRHPQTTRDIIGSCMRQHWSIENIAIATLGQEMASFSDRCQNFSRNINAMVRKTCSKGIIL